MEPEWGKFLSDNLIYLGLGMSTTVLVLSTSLYLTLKRGASKLTKTEDEIIKGDYIYHFQSEVRSLPEDEQRLAIPVFIEGHNDGYDGKPSKYVGPFPAVYNSAYSLGEIAKKSEANPGRFDPRQFGDLEEILRGSALAPLAPSSNYN